MNYRYLGKTGLKVSELCLGTMTFGREADAATSQAILDRFVAAGGTFIDTANTYGRGRSEEVIGSWLRGKDRDSLIIATKVRFPMGDGPNTVGLSRKHILSSIEASLRRLGTDYIDIYQTHAWDAMTPLEEALGTLNDLVRDGKVRYLGASNHTGYQLQRAIDCSRRMGWEAYTCLQPQYNLLCRSPEWELVPVCTDEGLGIIPWSPLRGGWLTGKYQRVMAEPPHGTRAGESQNPTGTEGWERNANEHTWRVLDALASVAAEMGRSSAQVAIRWLLQRPGVTAPIIGARSLTQLNDNLSAVDFKLSEGQMQHLDAVSDVALPYPYDFLANAARRR